MTTGWAKITSVVPLPGDLAAALDDVLVGVLPADLARVVESLVAGYRDATAAGAPLSAEQALAYAAYRMPATYAAVRAVGAALVQRAPSYAPRSLLDVGGGTGAATWALTDAAPSLAAVTVVEPAPAMVALGRRLARGAQHPGVRSATWVDVDVRSAAALPSADVVVMSYALGELPEPDRADVVRRLVASAPTVVIVEPGTPVGYRTVLAARDSLIGAGLRVVAPCPHSAACPLRDAAPDWCHFAVRVERTARHRQLKGGALGYEDEKYAYVVASVLDLQPASGRVIRHPQHRKGHTLLRVCDTSGEIVDTTVSKRHGPAYRAVRNAAWGDAWPPP
jgi:ribosomal protein RSM22 (predicted rRNA methylase)